MQKLNLASGSPRQRPRASSSVKFTLPDGSVLRAANIAQKLEKAKSGTIFQILRSFLFLALKIWQSAAAKIVPRTESIANVPSTVFQVV